MIPLLDLKAVNAQYQADIEAAVLRVARSGWYILTEEVEAFEREWANEVGAYHCVGTANALEAMQLVLMAYGIGPGDEVIVPSNTYIATWLAVTHAGARVVPVEPDYGTFNIDPTKIAQAVTDCTRAVLSVHLYGHPAPMDQIIAAAPHLLHIEDAAQAHGAVCYFRNGSARPVGCIGNATCFSFYPSKNLGAMGDAGAVTTDSLKLSTSVARLRNYGGVGRLDHRVRGINSRMDSMQAAILRAKLPHLKDENAKRGYRAMRYAVELHDTPVKLPPTTPGSVYHQYVLRSPVRDKIIDRAARMGLDLHVHYPVPPHLEGAYRDMGFTRGEFPIAERLASEVFSVPIGYDFDPRVYSVLRQAIKESQ